MAITGRNINHVADQCAHVIRMGYVKKKDVTQFIHTMAESIRKENHKFSLVRFEKYIKDRI